MDLYCGNAERAPSGRGLKSWEFPVRYTGPALCQVEKYLSVRLTTKLCDVNSVRTASTRCVLVYHSVSSQCTAFYILFVDSFRGAEECSHLGGGWEGLGKGISFWENRIISMFSIATKRLGRLTKLPHRSDNEQALTFNLLHHRIVVPYSRMGNFCQ